jgi:hypothetical protein
LLPLALLISVNLAALSPLHALADDSSATNGSATSDDSAPGDAAPDAAWTPLDQINAYRSLAGVAPASFNPQLGNSSAGQVSYYELNLGSPALNGMGLHEQQPNALGFTGSSIGARARTAGYSAGAVTENAGFGGLTAAIDWAMGTVNHRLPLIHPSALDIGYAVSDSTSFNIIDSGLRRTALNVTLPSAYPGDGATDVPTSWDGGETPDPAPGVRRPLGYPITVAFAANQRVDWTSFELFDPAGESLEISTPKTDWMRAAAIIPHRPLLHGATYTARISAQVDGKPLTREWSFTTA